MGIQNNLKNCDSSGVSWPHSSSGNFYGSENRNGIFWGLNFGPSIFWGFDFRPHYFDHPCHLKSGVPPPPPQGPQIASVGLGEKTMSSQRSIKDEAFLSGAGTTKKLHSGGEISSKKVHY